MAGYNYQNPEASVQAQKDAIAAREGLIPEGRYMVTFMGAKYHPGNNPTKSIWRWDLKCKFHDKPSSAFNRAERNISFFESESKMHVERMPQFIAFLRAMGLNPAVDFKPAKGKKDTDMMLDWLDRAFENHLKFEVDVKNQNKWDAEKREYVLDEKYQTFDIVIESVPQLFGSAEGSRLESAEAEEFAVEEDTAPEVHTAAEATQPAAVKTATGAQRTLTVPPAASAARPAGRVMSPFGGKKA